jgi:hypothetical protein
MKGGVRPGAGRKPKADEKRMRDKVSPYVEGAIEEVVRIMKHAEKDADRLAASKLIIEYWGGKPQISIDHTTEGTKLPPPIQWLKPQ